MHAIQQIAALPYRIADDGSAQVLLVTSRDTRRWVLPKGNPMRGYSLHEAAAVEAFEEAGVRGIPCPTALGTFIYWKTKRARLSRQASVTLYPLAVVEQLDDWPERGQRTARWFSLAGAAEAVDEPELKRLIAGFRAPPAPSGLASRVLPALQTRARRRFPVLGWFHRLMPSQGRFFDQFEAHAQTLVAGAEGLARLLHGEGEIPAMIEEIVRREHEADDITRDVLQDVRRVFVTPFDRSAITDLIGTMDDAIDQMNQTGNTIGLYGVTSFEPQMRDMSGIIVEAARIVAEAMPLLRSLHNNAGRLHELTERLIQIEGHADHIHDEGLRALFKASRDDPMQFITGKEIYSHLERVVDKFEDVANEIQGLVIDHA